MSEEPKPSQEEWWQCPGCGVLIDRFGYDATDHEHSCVDYLKSHITALEAELAEAREQVANLETVLEDALYSGGECEKILQRWMKARKAAQP